MWKSQGIASKTVKTIASNDDDDDWDNADFEVIRAFDRSLWAF